MKKHAGVLKDHVRRGKKLLPPFLAHFGEQLSEISWVDTLLPELIWIDLIQQTCGAKHGVEIITRVTRLARREYAQKGTIFFRLSDFALLSEEAKAHVCDGLAKERQELSSALHHLSFWYPECPLSFLTGRDERQGDLQVIRSTVARLFNREHRDSMMTQATAIWIFFDSGSLVVNSDLALAQFPEIQRYPDTELSRQVAGSIRAGLNAFYGHGLEKPRGWPFYFWNRGIETSDCEFDEPA
jgi:hypothetical protein